MGRHRLTPRLSGSVAKEVTSRRPKLAAIPHSLFLSYLRLTGSMEDNPETKPPLPPLNRPGRGLLDSCQPSTPRCRCGGLGSRSFSLVACLHSSPPKLSRRGRSLG